MEALHLKTFSREKKNDRGEDMNGIEGIISELKELAWDHHAGFENRLNKAANHLRNCGELESDDVTELKLMVMECAELAARIANVLKVIGVKEIAYAV